MDNHHNTLSVSNAAGGHRLPRTFLPYHYTLRETPDFESFLFKGSVEIEGILSESTNEIVLHARDLIFQEAYMLHADGTRLDAVETMVRVYHADPSTLEKIGIDSPSAAFPDVRQQRVIFKFDDILSPGKWKLVTCFTGSMVQPSLEGFYRSKWTDAEDKDHWIGTTQFEATHARRAFPCFDEPDVKATFDITLVVAPHLTALSNSCIKSEKVENGKKTVTFHTTAKMSTYLVAFCIGSFESSEPIFANGKEVRIWSPPGKNNLKSYALRCGGYGIEWYERTIGVRYFGGDKIDMIAIPDFRSGAMENTGLITYRATALLVDEEKATISELQRVSEVVFHELAHQWFGNLVTMAWWDGLPLNESNATIFAYLVMDEFMPEWRIFDSFGLSRSSAMALDSLKSTHSCWAPVGHPDEVEQRFDQITYEKGGSLEFQIQRYIGDTPFYRGMNIYLERFRYGNAEVTDLWDAIEDGAQESGLDIPVRKIMDAWFLADGHPLVTVSESDKPGFIKLRQERFVYLNEGETGQLWPIPIHLRYTTAHGGVKEKKLLFTSREQEIFIDTDFLLVIVNAGGSGFYRVHYSDKMLSRLMTDIFSSLEIIERYNLLNDSWHLVQAQKLNTITYINLIKTLANESDPNVWSIIISSLNVLHRFTEGAHRTAFKVMIRDLIKPVFAKLGWQAGSTDSSATLKLRGSLAHILGTIGEDKDTQAEAAKLFTSWKADRSSVDPNVVPALISILAYTDGKARFGEFEALADKAPTDQERLRFLKSLGEFRSRDLYESALAKMLSDVKTDDAPFILGSFLYTEHAGHATWNFISANWEQIQTKFPPSAVVRMLAGCSALDTEELALQVEEFFATNKVRQGDMAISQMLERLSVNLRLRKTETPRLNAFLVPISEQQG